MKFESWRGNIPIWQNSMQGVQKRVGEGYFRKGADILINRTPGRLDLMGGNDDYTGGLVFETTIREATWLPSSLARIRRCVFTIRR